jgi:centrosomal protein CEP76
MSQQLSSSYVSWKATEAVIAGSSPPPLLSVHISGARGLFVPVIHESGTTGSNKKTRTLQVHIAFGKSVKESSEIELTDEGSDLVIDFSTTLESDLFRIHGDLDSLLAIDTPILIYLSVSSSSHPCRTLIAAAIVDFRYALLPLGDSGTMSVELLQCDHDGTSLGVEAGVLFLGLSIRGLHSSSVREILNDIGFQKRIDSSISAFQDDVANANRVLYRSAKLFWSKMKQLFPYIEKRNVRILREDECCSHRFACSMISKISPPRDVISARGAARLVSLIPVTNTAGLTGESSSSCCSPFATLCKREGGIEDHAVLLCSLLLGWGLDAWVVLGLAVSPEAIPPLSTQSAPDLDMGPHCWVVTFSGTDLGSQFPKVTFWESTTGKQYEDVTFLSDSTNHSHHFREVHAIYNCDAFILNIQKNASVDPKFPSAVMSFAIGDDRSFQVLDFHPDSRRFLAHPGTRIALRSSRFNSEELISMESALEAHIRAEFKTWRNELGLSTTFEPTICTILQVIITFTDV